MRNDGREFEEQIGLCCEEYNRRRLLRLHKVEPPCRVLYLPGGSKKVIFLENPYSDFIGTWTEERGRTLLIETKSTSSERLPIGDNGIRPAQVEWLKRWHHSGAAVAVLWEFKNVGVCLLPIGAIWGQYRLGIKHLKWSEVLRLKGNPVPADKNLPVDFLPALREWYQS